MPRSIKETADRAGKLRMHYARSEFDKLPPAGEEWKWGDVAARGDDDGMPESAMHTVKPYLHNHGDGWYETSERLETYLDDKYGIECAGDAGRVPEPDPEQRELPGIEASPSTDTHARADGGDEDSMQVTFGGERADPEVLAAQSLDKHIESVKAMCAGGENQGRDATQMTIGVYDRATVGGFQVSGGELPSGEA
ncbi:hypothetical protein [Halorubrum yunnanense]|uniref:Uncharacterized protein n=1 Tax=Halorubrum yunnanense TaxID=1526162 RepID=A0ABD5YH29_9EURY|nr:hypothetical protein [Halorubrum yunnanense]